jgi:RpiR family carbohydrate utilization transcriptional regulator
MTADMRTELATLLNAMREVVATGRKAERRVAQVILDDVGLSARSSIGEIARRAQVSEPTVTRLCRTLGCNGTRDLKLRLAGALYSGVSYLQDITPTDDDVAAIKRKVVGGFLSTIDAVDRALDTVTLAAAVRMLAEARSIVFIGVGPGSATVVGDAPLRFIRLGISAFGYVDPQQQRIAVATLGPSDVVVAISNTGRSPEVVAALGIGRSHGARAIAITAPQSPLARAAELAITVPVVEDMNMYFPSYSRIPHLMIVDIVSTAVGLRRGQSAVDSVRRIKAALKSR